VKPAQDQYEAKECGTIRIGEQNISESLLSKGLALVIRHKKDDDDRSSVYDSLCAAEEKAKTEQKGMHSTKETPILRIFDASENASKAKQAFPSLQRAGKIHAIVEYCASASRFKVFIPSQNTKLTLVIAGIRAPRNARSPTEKGEPFGNEGLQFATQKLLQRDVEISIESSSKVTQIFPP
jgi:staphylococcal nuclease domain-containing protein 1